jgi:endonuclease YncB( thermonuclease family)
VSASRRSVCGALAVALTAACLATSAQAREARWLEGRVVSVEDGDTITVLDAARVQHRIRLAGIDAPERGQPGGVRSKNSLAAIVFEQPVRVEWNKRDAYGRVVGTVWVAPPDADCRGRPECPADFDAGLAQLAQGRAWWFRRYAAEQPADERARYEAAEALARERRQGLWRDGSAVPPWEWRQRQRARP